MSLTVGDPDRSREPVKFCGHCERETDDAELIYDGLEKIWIPKSQIVSKSQVGRDPDDYEYEIPYWLAKKKGII